MKITLCGSARFEGHFHHWNKVFTLAGNVVYSLACFPSVEGGKDWYNQSQKETLDAVHKLKITHSDAVFVLNVDGYLGESTLSEIEWARVSGKTVYFLESWAEGNGRSGHRSPIDTTISYGGWQDMWHSDGPLGPSGPRRSRLVKMIEAFRKTQSALNNP